MALAAVAGLTFLAILFVAVARIAGTASGTAHQLTIGIGQEGHINNDYAAPKVPVAVSETALDEMSSVKSDRAIAAVVFGGRAFLVDQNTRVSIIDSGGLSRKGVLIFDGAMTGRNGWVPTEWVSP